MQVQLARVALLEHKETHQLFQQFLLQVVVVVEQVLVLDLMVVMADLVVALVVQGKMVVDKGEQVIHPL